MGRLTGVDRRACPDRMQHAHSRKEPHMDEQQLLTSAQTHLFRASMDD
jgi:hypothetical protein